MEGGDVIKKLFVLISALSIICISANVSHSDEYWAKTYGGSGDDEAHYIQQTDDDGDGVKDDGYIVAGYTTEEGSENSRVLKLNSDGSIAWQKTYGEFSFAGFPSYAERKAYFIQQTSEGGYILAGGTTCCGAGGVDVLVLKLDSNGNVTWQKTYGGSDDDYAYAIQQTSDEGYIIVYGPHCRGCGSNVLKFDSDGNIVWQKTYNNDLYPTKETLDFVRSIQQTTDGGYIIAGTGICPYVDHYHPNLMMKLDSSGNVSWMKVYGIIDIPTFIQQTFDGGYIVVGETAGSPGYLWLMKLDSNGNVSWEKVSSYEDEIIFAGSSVQQTTDGTYIVASTSMIYDYGAGIYQNSVCLLKFDSDGNIIWQKTYGGDWNSGARSIHLTADGGYIVAGYTEYLGAGGKDFFVLKLDSIGNIPNCNVINTSNVSISDFDVVGSDCSVIIDSTSATPCNG